MVGLDEAHAAHVGLRAEAMLREAGRQRARAWGQPAGGRGRTARLKHHSMPSQAVLQASGYLRSRLRNSSQKVLTSMYSFSFQSTARTKWPSSLSRLARCEAMKPPAPATQILRRGKSLVKLTCSTGGRTIARQEHEAAATHSVLSDLPALSFTTLSEKVYGYL